MLRDTRGFTLIELLIVVVIIGILAAIAIPQFASTKERAFDATAKSDVRNAMAAQEAYFADGQTYAPNALATGNFTTSTGIAISTSAASAGGYAVTASHSSSGNTFWVQVGTGSSIEGKVQKSP
ncbi:MAG: prepilin-type N-terminal cleavage/methylation domain-containing protein [Gemmatimonadota bacterium]|nr:prepilin-type N-terminal cleavage/methylation domain-containing protein [Gemmatimonadota bacterium]